MKNIKLAAMFFITLSVILAGCKASADIPDPCAIETQGTKFGHTKEEIIKILEDQGFTTDHPPNIPLKDLNGVKLEKEDAQRRYKFKFTETKATPNFKRVTFLSTKSMKPGQDVDKPIPEKFFWKFYPHADEVNNLIETYCEKAKSVERGRCDIDDRNVKISFEERIEDGETIWGCGIDVQASSNNFQKYVTIGKTQ